MKPQFERLTPTFNFVANRHDRTNLEPIARALYALQQGVESLKNAYSAATGEQSSLGSTYPHRNYYMDDERKITFKYLRRLFSEKLLFNCVKTEDQTQLCVKFTKRYSVEAHQVCADHGVAPKLYSAEQLPGGWWMIVMEYLSEEEYCTRTTVKVDVDVLEQALKGAVRRLHQSGFVHGDIRACNIMVRCQWDNGIGMANVKLVDFDWAGQEGVVRYPANVNHVQMYRPPDARDGLPIKRDHDLEMLEMAVKNDEGTGLLALGS